ncbi:YciI family protein [Pandoraea sp. ISTKB]|uniref:YciI family protein n=1 Tax=Pandoraea sp. ISTKB TaxID=1586708 RepID=UPI0008469239|nr:YciI family protein [Pandoraea sp. ISTKB]ODP32993.1 GTP cyclohydrolase [Pandoraea sp. ISTKB]
MYIVELTYLQPVSAVDVQLEAHRAFLSTQYEREVFIASGPKDPREGGIIVVSGKVSREELDAIIAQDPFHIHGLASYRVITFNPVKFLPQVAGLL